MKDSEAEDPESTNIFIDPLRDTRFRYTYSLQHQSRVYEKILSNHQNK